ncbi:MAG: killer toxin resistant protein [Caeruleum heppii]|nr:MAG: killer toxin resistant protein [Caeruleum heppii]
MLFSGIVLLGCVRAVLSTSPSAAVFTFDSTSPSPSQEAPSLKAEAVRVWLSQRLGISQYHNTAGLDEETRSSIGQDGDGQALLQDAASVEDRPGKVVLLIEGVDQIEDIIPKAHRQPTYLLSDSPSPSANEQLIRDLSHQLYRASGNSVCSKEITSSGSLVGYLSVLPSDYSHQCCNAIKSLNPNYDENESQSAGPLGIERISSLTSNVCREKSLTSIFHIKTLTDVIQRDGINSEAYRKAVRAASHAVLSLSDAGHRRREHTIILFPPSTRKAKRCIDSYGSSHLLDRSAVARGPAEKLLEDEPASDGYSLQNGNASSNSSRTPIKTTIPVCYSSFNSCMTATNHCSGHGRCFNKYSVEDDSKDPEKAKHCFACRCMRTVLHEAGDGKGGKTIQWGGAACQKKDISSSFFLIAGGSIFFMAAVAWAIGLLFSIGEEQLPGVLGAGVSGARATNDSRIPALIRNGVQEKKRSFIVVVGDRAKDVIVNLHYIMSSVDVKQNKSVLWAYKHKLLGFTSHRKKREFKIKKEIKRGIRDANTEDPFELFVSLHNIRYVYYKETDKILGNTYGMCILQDFEAITPNLLARTIETVEGGGLVLLLLKGMNSLKQLYTLSMDIHSRYRTEAHDDVTARFNERFILSLGSCESCLVVDDELNVLPISGGKTVKPLPPAGEDDEGKTAARKELDGIKESLADTQPVGSLVTLAKTVDQAKALLTFVDAIAEKTLRSTVTLTAARGRGKSAALGVAIAAAIAHGYSNIFITSPSPENLKTLFEFIFKGFDALNYMDHADYTIIQSTNPDFNKAIVRVNVHRQHRQTIQYVQPQDAHVLGQAELLVIDEAAAIPLPLVRKLMGPYLVFMASTINGYEGTGRSLSLKLIQQLREQSRAGVKVNGDVDGDVADRSSGRTSRTDHVGYTGGRSLREITLSEPIRYAAGDAVEKWLNTVLCLDATLPRSKMNVQGCPHPSKCQLLQVNRDTLFSFHPVSEKFLQQMMALYVASHYKNSPNDLQLMSDAPAHQLFVLVPPVDDDSPRLPEPLCVVQVALEGQISKKSVLNSLGRGQRAGGDLIPWLVSQQFQDEEFAGLSGARVVRIATNPEYTGMGYGSQALTLLTDFYEGKFTDLSEDSEMQEPNGTEESLVRVTDAELSQSNLLEDDIKVRDIHAMPPLFSKLSERRPDALDYLGVSYGLTPTLHKFWKRASFVPVYLRQTPNELTGEHSCVMLRTLSSTDDPSWLGAFSQDFHKRFLTLLSYQFRAFPSILALSIDESATAGFALVSDNSPSASFAPLTKPDLDALLSPFDLKRLDSYANNMLDHHVILDLIPTISSLYFSGRLKFALKLSGVQSSILLAIGQQRKSLDELEKEIGLPSSQLLAMFVKIVRKVSLYFRGVVEGAVAAEEVDQADSAASGMNGSKKMTNVPMTTPANATGIHEDEVVDRRFEPLAQGLSEELDAGGDEAMTLLREKQRAMIDALPLDRYEIPTPSDPSAWSAAEQQIAKTKTNTNTKSKTNSYSIPSITDSHAPVVSVKSSSTTTTGAGPSTTRKRKPDESGREIYEREFGRDDGEGEGRKVKKSRGGAGKDGGGKKMDGRGKGRG